MSVPSSILFICGMNSIRSPMAEVIARTILPGGIFIQSAGLRKGKRDHFVDYVLKEINLDIGDHQPKVYHEEEDSFFDVIVALTPEAHDYVLEITRTQDIQVVFWPMDDPSLTKGTRNQILDAYRDIRNLLIERIKGQFLP